MVVKEFQIRSVLVSQAVLIMLVALVTVLFSSGAVSVLFGGLLVILSTWDVHRSAYASGGDRIDVLKKAGLRFVLFLLMLGLGLVLLDMQPLYLVAGMASAYVAMYARSLFMIFKQMKGDRLG